MNPKSKILVFVILLFIALFSGITIFFNNGATTITSTTTSILTITTTSTTETTTITTIIETTTITSIAKSTILITTTTLPCGEDFKEPCETEKGLSCKRGYIINSKGLCAPVKCSRGVKSGMDGCCSQALYWCMGDE